jgi:mannitol-specific phosphotransferase system IIBC component
MRDAALLLVQVAARPGPGLAVFAWFLTFDEASAAGRAKGANALELINAGEKS